MERRIRVLVAKPGLDGHDRGAKMICMALRDAGMEVIYSGLRQTTKAIANIAIQEDVDAVLLSCLSGAHDVLFPEFIEVLKQRGVEDMVVIGGGIIPKEDIPALKETGIKEIFGPGTKMKEIIEYIKKQNIS